MTNQLILGILLLFFGTGMLLITGCDRTPIDDPHFGVVDRVEVRDRPSNALYAFYEREQHGAGFQGPGVPHLHPGEEIALNVHFIDTNGNEAQLGTGQEFEVRAEIVGEEGIVAVSDHGDHVDVDALAEGETHIVFHLWHGNHPDFTTPALEIEVEDHD